jgi:hypothetical protein
VKYFLIAIIITALAGCRGEPVPRDYQNAPPAMTHPPQSKKETPAANGMGKVAPQPTTGVEGTAGPYKTVTPTPQPTTTTIGDTPPAATTNT